MDFLDDGHQFCCLLAECNNLAYRDLVIAHLLERFPRQQTISALNDNLLAALQQAASVADLIHLVDTNNWFDTEAGADGSRRLNQRQEWLAQQVPLGIVVWMLPHHLDRFARQAPDLWAWRKAVIDFCNQAEDRPTGEVFTRNFDAVNAPSPEFWFIGG